MKSKRLIGGRIDLEVLRAREFANWRGKRKSKAVSSIEPLETRQLLSAGDFDPSFGAGGHVIPTAPPVSTELINAVAQQADGKLVEVVSNSSTHQVGVRRLNSNGSVDTLFASGGTFFLTPPSGSSSPTLNDVLVQKDGKIVAGGSLGSATTFERDFLVLRLTTSGALDTGFSGDGINTASFYNGGYAEAFELAQQPDGKILAGGNAVGYFGIARFNTNGTLDNTFDGDGRTAPDLPGTGNGEKIAGIALTSDGKVLAVGSSDKGLALARYTTSGALDTSFGGGDGVTYFNPGSSGIASGKDLAIQSDGRIVSVGTFGQGLLVARFSALGTIDGSFGVGGTLPVPTGRRLSGASKVAIQSDGKVLVGGAGLEYATPATLQADFARDVAVERLNTNGSIDATFGKGGIAVIGLTGDDNTVTDMTLKSDGKILLSGYGNFPATSSSSPGVLVRLSTTGTPDASFGINGRVGFDAAGKIGSYSDVVIQPGGKIVAVGQTQSLGGGGQDMLVSRFNSNGSLDTSFGTGGQTLIDFFGFSDSASSVALAPDGKIVVSGTAFDENQVEVATARLNANGTLDTTFSGDGKLAEFQPLGAQTPGGYTGGPVAVQADGKIVVVAHQDGIDTHDSVIRYTTSGAHDTSFSGDGVFPFDSETALDPLALWNTAGLAIQSDGKIVLLASNRIGKVSQPGFLELVRLTPGGILDTSFGSGEGFAQLPLGDFPIPHGMTLASNGDILITGQTNISIPYTFVAARFNSTGQFLTQFPIEVALSPVIAGDGSFYVTSSSNFTGSPQKVVHYSAAGVRDAAFSNASASDNIGGYALALQPDGNIIEVGRTTNDIGRPAVSRLLGSNVTPPPPGGDISIVGGVLTVTGTDNADVITIDPGAAGQVIAKLNTTTKTFNLADFTSILVNANGGNDTVTINNAITKPAKLLGSAGNDSLVGGGGNDTLDGGAGGDTMKGGGGNDTADYSSRTANLTIGLGTLNDDGEAGEKDNVYLDIETVLGGSGNDTITGGDANNLLVGNAGNDSLNGNFGDDTLSGDAGTDTLNGANGTDTAINSAGDTLISIEINNGGGSGGTAALVARTVVVTGTDGNDTVNSIDDFVIGQDKLTIGINGNNFTFARGTFDNLLFNLNGGDDTLNLMSGADLDPTDPTVVNAGNGNDTISLSVSQGDNCTINGEGGNDSVTVDQFGTHPYFNGGPGIDTYLNQNQDSGDLDMDLTMPNTENATVWGGNLYGNGFDNNLMTIKGELVDGRGGNDHISGAGAADVPQTLIGGDGNDTLVGMNGGDVPAQLLQGGPGNDLLQGGDGDDTLDGGTGADTFQGGTGNDTADYSSRTAPLTIGVGVVSDDGEAGEHDNVQTDIETILSGSGNDTITGGDANNLIVGNGGNDSLNGNFGDDTLSGDAGDDTLNGANGTDTAINSEGDTLISIEVNDSDSGPGIFLLPDGTLIVKSDGIVVGPSGPDSVSITQAADGTLQARTVLNSMTVASADVSRVIITVQNFGHVVSITGNGNTPYSIPTTVNGGDSFDTLELTNAQNIKFFAGAGDDEVISNDGSLSLYDGGAGFDFYNEEDFTPTTLDLASWTSVEGAQIEVGTLLGNSENNALAVLHGGMIDGRGGNDTVSGGLSGQYTLLGGDGNDTLTLAYLGQGLTNSALMDGGPGNDTITGGNNADTLIGGDGDDVLNGRAGADLFQGGNGNDTADYSDRTENLHLGIGTLADDGAAGEGDNISSDIETVLGGSGNDTITGTNHAERLVGNAGNDSILAGGGNDTLSGDAGTDTLNGEDGTDTAINSAGDILISIEKTA